MSGSGRIPGRWFAAILLLAAVLPVSARAGLYEKGGALGLGARAMGLAGAYTALAEDGTAVWWNPAGLSETEALRLQSSFGSLYDGRLRSAALAAAYPLPQGAAVGLAWMHEFYPEAVEVNADTLGLGGSLPLSYDHRLRLGASLKFLFGGIRVSRGAFLGTGVDVGLRYHLPLSRTGENLDFGLRVQDLDTRIRWDNGVQEQIPQSLALGTAYHYDAATALALDLEMIQAGRNQAEDVRVLRVGAERWFQDMFALRAGYLLNNLRTNTFSAGAGFKYAGWEIEYALVGQVANLGLSHRLSLSYGLPVLAGPRPEATPAPTPERAPAPQAFKASLLPSADIFSPNGDGVSDTVSFRVRLLQGEPAQAASWQLGLQDAGGQVLRYFEGRGYPEPILWDGKDDFEKPVPDGPYQAKLLLQDSRGESLALLEAPVEVRTKLPPVRLSVEPPELVLYGTRPAAKLVFRLRGAEKVPDVSWQLLLRNAAQKTVKSFRGDRTWPERIPWSGQDDRGGVVPAGTLEAVLRVEDSVGNQAGDRIQVPVVKLQPSLRLDLTPKMFKPGDEAEGTVTFKLQAQPEAHVLSWKLVIQNAETGRTVRVFADSGQAPATLVWNGKDNQGKWVKGGQYFYCRLQATFTGGLTRRTAVRAVASDVSTLDTGKALALYLTAVPFESGSYSIPLDAFKNLQQAVDTIKKYAKRYRVQVKGHADTREAPGKEFELSRQRAQRVAEFLEVSGKIPGDLIDAVGYGTLVPLAPETTAAGRAKNRRAEVVLIILK